MKFRLIICAALLSLGGCGLTPPPPPPIPPLPKGPLAPPTLSVGDVVLLQKISLRSIYMKTATDLAAMHSKDELIKGFAAQQVKDYDGLSAAAQKVADTHTLTLVGTLPTVQQNRLTMLGKSYGRPFDRSLLYILTHSLTKQERVALTQAKKNGSTADMKSLAGVALDLLDRSQQQGRGLMSR